MAQACTKEELLDETLIAPAKLRVFRAIPWLRKYASKKFGPCAGKHWQRGAMVNLIPRQSRMTKYFLMK